MTERYYVRLIGPTTNNRWRVVAEQPTRKFAAREYCEWLRTHGDDHYVVLVDTNASKGSKIILSHEPPTRLS